MYKHILALRGFNRFEKCLEFSVAHVLSSKLLEVSSAIRIANTQFYLEKELHELLGNRQVLVVQRLCKCSVRRLMQ